MVDDGPSGPQHELWALPAEELPPGAAIFLDMARDLQAGLSDAVGAWVATDGHTLPEAGPDDDAAEPSEGRPHLRVVESSDPGDESARVTDAPADGGPGDVDQQAAARVFLEMVDRVDTVRPLTPPDSAPELSVGDWLWSAGEGIPAAEVLLGTIEQAIQHVNHSEDIRSEEVRGRLLDLFGDFAVRRPWKGEERPGAQRRLAEGSRDEGPSGSRG